jgi:hypothetical protein
MFVVYIISIYIFTHTHLDFRNINSNGTKDSDAHLPSLEGRNLQLEPWSQTPSPDRIAERMDSEWLGWRPHDVGSGFWCFWLRSWWALDMHSMRPSMRPEILFATWSTQHMVFLYRCCISSPNVFLLPLSRSVQQGSPFEKASVLTQWQLNWHCQLVFYCGSLWFRYVLAKKAHMPIGIGHMFAQNTLCIQCYSASGIEQMIFTYVRHGMACSISWHLLRPGATNQEKPGEYFDCIDEFSVHLLLSHGLPR